VRRRQFLGGVAAGSVTGVSGCTDVLDSDGGRGETAVVAVRNWRETAIEVSVAVTPVTDGTASCRNATSTPTGDSVSVEPDERVEITTLRPGSHDLAFRGSGYETSRCIQHEGDRSVYTFVVDDTQVVFTAESTDTTETA
jgi:hypothetical protein